MPVDRTGGCSHCGHRHLQASGRLKMYIGAMQCRLYVELLFDEMSGWGMSTPPGVTEGQTASTLTACGAGEDFTCYHKGGETLAGMPRCMSPDGFTSEVQGEAKAALGPLGDLRVNSPLQCPHRVTKRARQGVDPAPQGNVHVKGFKQSQMNRMPGGDDPRRAVVFRELDRRIAILRRVKVQPTPDAIARLGGFIEHRRVRRDGE